MPAALHFCRCHRLELMLEHPLVAKGIAHRATAVSVKLVIGGPEHDRPRRTGTGDRGINI